MHNADLLSLGRQEQSWRARDTKRGKSLFAWNDSSSFCPPVPNKVIESPRENRMFIGEKERRGLNVLDTLDSVWTVGFKSKIGLLRQIIAGLVTIKHETSENRRRVELWIVKGEALSLHRHEVRSGRDEMGAKRNNLTLLCSRRSIASKSEDGLDYSKTLLIDHDLEGRRL
jgi:hypothetical protein